MIIGLTNENWIEQLGTKKTSKFLELVDALVIVGSNKFSEKPYYFVNEEYNKVKEVLTRLSNTKPYPQCLWWSTNYSLVEIENGCTPEALRKKWLHELQTRNLV